MCACMLLFSQRQHKEQTRETRAREYLCNSFCLHFICIIWQCEPARVRPSPSSSSPHINNIINIIVIMMANGCWVLERQPEANAPYLHACMWRGDSRHFAWRTLMIPPHHLVLVSVESTLHTVNVVRLRREIYAMCLH